MRAALIIGVIKIYSGTGAPYTIQLKVSRFIDILLAKCGALSENIPKK